jgi:ACR3 family arsenite transporter
MIGQGQKPVGEFLAMPGKLLLSFKKRLYMYVAVDFILALAFGLSLHVQQMDIKPVSMVAVFLMLYPMLTGMMVEKVKKAGRNYKLIAVTLFFVFFVASGTAYVVSRTVFVGQPELALGIILVGAIPCSNMLIGWSGIADASVEDALVIAVIGLLLIPVLSPFIVHYSGGPMIPINTKALILNLLLYILVPMILGYLTRKAIIHKKGLPYFMDMREYFAGISAIGILVIVFFSVAKVAPQVVQHPMVFLLVAGGLFLYYVTQTALATIAAKMFRFDYGQGMVLILAATASSQAISLALAATMFNSLTVFALSFKPVLQVLYIMFLIYALGPKVRLFL